jgi:hypothetical protein
MKSIFMLTIDSNGSGDEKEPSKFYHKLSWTEAFVAAGRPAASHS